MNIDIIPPPVLFFLSSVHCRFIPCLFSGVSSSSSSSIVKNDVLLVDDIWHLLHIHSRDSAARRAVRCSLLRPLHSTLSCTTVSHRQQVIAGDFLVTFLLQTLHVFQLRVDSNFHTQYNTRVFSHQRSSVEFKWFV